MNSTNRVIASAVDTSRLPSTATAKTDWAAVSASSSRCGGASGRPWTDDDASANAIGSEPTSTVHWLTFDDTRALSPVAARNLHASTLAITSSGASDASGATHWTRKKSPTPTLRPADTRASAKVLAHSTTTSTATTTVAAAAERRAAA